MIQKPYIIEEGYIGDMYIISKKEEKGFLFDYVLFVPTCIPDETTLLVEPVNTGKCAETLEEALQDSLSAAFRKNYTKKISFDLKMPLLIPLFPRMKIHGQPVYTHALSSDTLSLQERSFLRLDLQLLSMISDAKEVMQRLGSTIQPKVVILGFSASSKFSNRFTLLHPEIVSLCIGGGIGGSPTLPLEEYKGKKLVYPVGMFGYKCDLEALKKVKHFYYMGELDENDSSLFPDAYKESEKALLDEILGSSMKERFQKSEKIYKELGLWAIFLTYPNFGHTSEPAIEDIEAFIKDNCYLL